MIKLTNKEFEATVEQQFQDCREILIEKTKEYVLTDDDRFSAFKLKWLHVLPTVNKKEVLWGQMVKHLNSIHDMCMINDDNYDLAMADKWVEKITDTINYLIILRGIVSDNITEVLE